MTQEKSFLDKLAEPIDPNDVPFALVLVKLSAKVEEDVMGVISDMGVDTSYLKDIPRERIGEAKARLASHVRQQIVTCLQTNDGIPDGLQVYIQNIVDRFTDFIGYKLHGFLKDGMEDGTEVGIGRRHDFTPLDTLLLLDATDTPPFQTLDEVLGTHDERKDRLS